MATDGVQRGEVIPVLNLSQTYKQHLLNELQGSTPERILAVIEILGALTFVAGLFVGIANAETGALVKNVGILAWTTPMILAGLRFALNILRERRKQPAAEESPPLAEAPSRNQIIHGRLILSLCAVIASVILLYNLDSILSLANATEAASAVGLVKSILVILGAMLYAYHQYRALK